MLKTKRIISILLTFALLITFTACRPKDESAFTFGDMSAEKNDVKNGRVDIRAALYIIFMANAQSEFGREFDKQEEAAKPTEAPTEAPTLAVGQLPKTPDEPVETPTEAIDYKTKTLDGKTYSDWVHDKAEELAVKYAQAEIDFEKKDLSFTEEESGGINNAVSEMWKGNQENGTQPFSVFAELNGIKIETLHMYIANQKKQMKLFEHYYMPGGEKGVPQEELDKKFTDNYALASIIHVSLKQEDEEGTELPISSSKKAAFKEGLDKTVEKLKKGMDFVVAEEEFNWGKKKIEDGETEKIWEFTEKDHEDCDHGNEDDDLKEGEIPPLKKGEYLFGSEETEADSKYYERINVLKTGDIEILEFENDCFMLVIKKDILKSPYSVDRYTPYVLRMLKGDAWEKDLLDAGSKITKYRNDACIKAYRQEEIIYTAKP